MTPDQLIRRIDATLTATEAPAMTEQTPEQPRILDTILSRDETGFTATFGPEPVPAASGLSTTEQLRRDLDGKEAELRTQDRAVRALANELDTLRLRWTAVDADRTRWHQTAAMRAGVIRQHAAELTAAGDLITGIRERLEGIDRLVAAYDSRQPATLDETVDIERILDVARTAWAAADDQAERVWVLSGALEAWYAVQPPTAVTDPHDGVARWITGLLEGDRRQALTEAADRLWAWAEEMGDVGAAGLARATRKRTIKACARKIAPEPTDDEMRDALANLLGGMADRAKTAPAAAPVPAPRAHVWADPTDLVRWPHCSTCGIVRRHDDQHGPCKGPVTIELRDQDEDAVALGARWLTASGIPVHPDDAILAWLNRLGVPVPTGIRPLLAEIQRAVIAAGDVGYAAGRAQNPVQSAAQDLLQHLRATDPLRPADWEQRATDAIADDLVQWGYPAANPMCTRLAASAVRALVNAGLVGATADPERDATLRQIAAEADQLLQGVADGLLVDQLGPGATHDHTTGFPLFDPAAELCVDFADGAEMWTGQRWNEYVTAAQQAGQMVQSRLLQCPQLTCTTTCPARPATTTEAG